MNLYYNLLTLIRAAFWVYGMLIFVRVISSWIPNVTGYKFMRFLFSLVDPYLNFFRRFIPPIGGTVDISPIVAFFALQLLEKLIVWALF